MTKYKHDNSDLDVLSLLDSIGVDYKTSGKNVTVGWANINCAFCYDSSSHLGVNLSSKMFSCWICRESGSIFKLVKKLTGLDNPSVGRLLHEHKKSGFLYDGPVASEESIIKKFEVSLPTHISEKPSKIHKEFLANKKFNHKEIEFVYGIKYSKQISTFLKSNGKRTWFSNRIIIPIIMNGKLVNFTARDVTGLSDERYKNCPNDDAIFHTKDCIYGYDQVIDGGTGIIVEGPTDVWGIGPGGLGIMGLKYTENQMKALYRKNLSRVFIFMDNEKNAQSIAKKIASEIGSFVSDVFIIEPEKSDADDPGSMSKKQRKELKMLIGSV